MYLRQLIELVEGRLVIRESVLCIEIPEVMPTLPSQVLSVAVQANEEVLGLRLPRGAVGHGRRY